MSIVNPKHPSPIDESATHFRVGERAEKGGYFITLYRYREGWPAHGQTECQCTPEMKERMSSCHFCINKRMGIRPEYKGPMGWKFHSSDTDPTPEQLYPVDKLFEITGDKPDGSEFNNANMYAGL